MRARVMVLTITGTMLIAGAASALGVRSVEVDLGATWMTQSFKYSGVRIFAPDGSLPGPAGSIAWSLGSERSEALTLQFGVTYLQKGFRAHIMRTDENGIVLGSEAWEARAHYVSVPVLIRWVPLPRRRFAPYLEAGPSAEIRFSQDARGVFGEMDRVSLGYHAGVGARHGRIHAGLRYLADLTNAYAPPQGATLESVRDHGVLLQVGYDLLPWLHGSHRVGPD